MFRIVIVKRKVKKRRRQNGCLKINGADIGYGKYVCLFGENLCLEPAEGRTGNCRVGDGVLYLSFGKGEPSPERREKALKEALRSLLYAETEKYIGKWQNITGLECAGLAVKDMYTRWGSCNIATKKINISLMLAQKDRKYLDYVVLHELIHTKIRDHGADFKASLSGYMPEWKELRAELNGKRR